MTMNALDSPLFEIKRNLLDTTLTMKTASPTFPALAQALAIEVSLS